MASFVDRQGNVNLMNKSADCKEKNLISFAKAKLSFPFIGQDNKFFALREVTVKL